MIYERRSKTALLKLGPCCWGLYLIPPLASKKSCTDDSQSEILFDKSYSVYHQHYRRSSLYIFFTKYAEGKSFGEAIQMLKTFDQFIQVLKEWCLVTLDKMYSWYNADSFLIRFVKAYIVKHSFGRSDVGKKTRFGPQ